jgi:multiple sugar transport system substrate-binding protein
VKRPVSVFRFWCLFACFSPALGCHEDSSGKVHITYWEKWSGLEGEAMQAVVDAFNRSQDRVEVEYVALSVYVDRKTLVATAGGDPPDVAGIYVYNIYSFADEAALTPLDEYIRQEQVTPDEWLSRYEPAFAGLGRYNGEVWALPSAPSVVALHWNKALFREAGLDPDRPPETVAELDGFAEKLTQRDPESGALVQLGFLPQTPLWWAWAYPIWFGGRLFDGEKVTADGAANEAAFEWVASYAKRYGADDIKAFTSGLGNIASPQSGFLSGKLAMSLQGAWFDNFIRQYAPGLEYGMVGFPRTPSGPANFTVADADMLVIPRGAKHPAAAWEFIKYVSFANPRAESKEELSGVELLCYLQEKSSPLRQWSPFFERHHPHPHVDILRALGSSPNAATYPKLGIWQEYQRELLAAFDDVRTLRKTPHEALAACQSRVEASFAWHERGLRKRAAKAP